MSLTLESSLMINEEINKAECLSDLNNIIASCNRCSLSKTKTKDVFGSGSEKAEIFFIGEAPGKEEDLRGEPFVGAAGKFLGEMLKENGLNRNNVFMANVLKHRPPENRDPLPEEVDACWPFLEKQIQIVNPKIIVFLGRHALNRFFPSLKISEVHGRAFRKSWQGKDQVFLALYHPAAALYNGSMRETLKSDFKKIPTLITKIKKTLKPQQKKLI